MIRDPKKRAVVTHLRAAIDYATRGNWNEAERLIEAAQREISEARAEDYARRSRRRDVGARNAERERVAAMPREAVPA